MRELREVRRVPGRIDYNKNRRLEIKLPVAGAVTSVLVQLGQRVKTGDRLAILTSTEVGLARAEVEAAEADLQLALKESEWSTQISDNLAELGELLANHPDMKTVEVKFDDRTLGTHRDHVLSAYSKMLVAKTIQERTESVVSTGGVSGLIGEQRRSDREVAEAQFKSVLEQSMFDASQQQLRAEAASDSAKRQLEVRRQKLELLIGPFAEVSAVGPNGASCELVLRRRWTGWSRSGG